MKNMEETLDQLQIFNSNKNGSYNGQQELHLKILTNEKQFLDLESEWKELAQKSDTTVYQTFNWNKIWWKYFGAGKKLHIITVYKSTKLVGIFPFFVDTISLAGLELYSCLRFIGSTVSQPQGEELKGLLPYSDYLGAIIHQGLEHDVCQIFLAYLNSELPFDELILDELPEDSKLLQALFTYVRQNDINFAIKDASICPVIRLKDTWEEYLSDLSKSSRYRVRRYVKRANKKGYKVFEVETVNALEELGSVYDALVHMHQQRWNAAGFPGAFAEVRFYDFLKEATRELMKEGRAEFKVARALEEDNQIIAVDLNYKYDKKVYLVHRGFDIHAETNDYGPGNVLLYQGVKDAIEENYTEVDFLRGAESYKFRSANHTIQNKELTISLTNNFRRRISHLAKKIVTWKRRISLEFEQVQITMEGQPWYEGITEYGNFVYSRINRKFSE